MGRILPHYAIWMASAAVVAYGIYRLWKGLRVKLFLVNQDNPLLDQAYIQVNTPHRRRTLVKTLLRREWEDRIDVVLADFTGAHYTFEFVHHVLWQYYVVPRVLGAPARVAGRDCVLDKPVRVHSGASLELADRKYQMLITEYEAGQFGLYDGERSAGP